MLQKDQGDSLEILDDLGDEVPPEREGRVSKDKGLLSRPEVRFGLAGAGGLLLLLVILLASGGSGVKQEDLERLNKRLDQLDQRFAKLEQPDKRLQTLEGHIGSLQQGLAKQEGADRALRERLDKLSQQVEKTLERPAPPPPQAKTPGVKEVQKGLRTEEAKKYHTVKKGETLYEISKKYKVTVEQLKAWNGIKGKEGISPGQRLVVSS